MHLEPVASRNLAAVGYDPLAAELQVLFRSGRLYSYAGVPDSVHRALMDAPSKGRFFHWWIRWRYPYRRLA